MRLARINKPGVFQGYEALQHCWNKTTDDSISKQDNHFIAEFWVILVSGTRGGKTKSQKAQKTLS